ncbi:MAG: lamin tail domain-containing protein [Pirellulaceae bacterium]|nr:lamin tail domain-containing protein [Pirellulaceae bacterium]
MFGCVKRLARTLRGQNQTRLFEILEARRVLDSTVVFSEIMYHPPPGATENLEWIELQNQLRADMDISEWRLDGGVDYTFRDGTIVPGRGQIVIAASPTAFSAATGVPAEGPCVVV